MDLLPGCFVSLRFLRSLSRNLYQLSLYSPTPPSTLYPILILHPLTPIPLLFSVRFHPLPFTPLLARKLLRLCRSCQCSKVGSQGLLPPLRSSRGSRDCTSNCSVLCFGLYITHAAIHLLVTQDCLHLDPPVIPPPTTHGRLGHSTLFSDCHYPIPLVHRVVK
ncbi:hypothetical protein BDV98DRAFT_65019 [Pterulicium gracile]|uniref:Uncharacterized protein n=1 Tax=Pterulicium gracile TaxID=1884261 RepID=A0A5C3QIB9_9AGAR|nr:hypothetical protein BDV98DRAFT_65019 [Pterula gracilis]